MSRIIGVVLTFLGGLYFFLEFLLPEEINARGEVFKFGQYYQEVSLGVSLVSGVAIGLGVINILLIHGKTFLSWRRGAVASFSLLFFFFVTVFFQASSWIQNEKNTNSWKTFDAVVFYLKGLNGDPGDGGQQKIKTNLNLMLENEKFLPLHLSVTDLNEVFRPYLDQPLDEARIDALIKDMTLLKVVTLKKSEASLGSNFTSKMENLILKGLFFPLGMSMFSLLAFYISYAAYRTFRVQSKEALVMMIAAFLIILGQIPQGANYLSADLPELRFWIMEYLSTPAFRAIYFSSAIAGLGLAVRMWFSMEKNPF